MGDLDAVAAFVDSVGVGGPRHGRRRRPSAVDARPGALGPRRRRPRGRALRPAARARRPDERAVAARRRRSAGARDRPRPAGLRLAVVVRREGRARPRRAHVELLRGPPRRARSSWCDDAGWLRDIVRPAHRPPRGGSPGPVVGRRRAIGVRRRAAQGDRRRRGPRSTPSRPRRSSARTAATRTARASSPGCCAEGGPRRPASPTPWPARVDPAAPSVCAATTRETSRCEHAATVVSSGRRRARGARRARRGRRRGARGRRPRRSPRAARRRLVPGIGTTLVALREHPRERDLRRGRAVAGGDARDRVDDPWFAAMASGGEARQAGPEVVAANVARAERAGEEAAAERCVRQERDAVLACTTAARRRSSRASTATARSAPTPPGGSRGRARAARRSPPTARSRAPCPPRRARRTRPTSPRAACRGRPGAAGRGRCGPCRADAARRRTPRGRSRETRCGL